MSRRNLWSIEGWNISHSPSQPDFGMELLPWKVLWKRYLSCINVASHIRQNFARLEDVSFTFYLGIALGSIWKQSRLDDSLYVVVSFFIANLIYIENIPNFLNV